MYPLSIFFLVLSLTLLSSHPTHYLEVERNRTCFDPEPAKIYSWHIHLLYWQNNEKHTIGAYQKRNKFISAFKEKLGYISKVFILLIFFIYKGPQCTDLFHQNQLCMFEPDKQPVGPFLTAQWAIFVTNDLFSETVQWFTQHRGIYDVLIHPNSGCELEDHSWWAIWAGTPWEINLDAMTHDQPFPWTNNTAKISEQELKQGKSTELIRKFLDEYQEN